MYAAVLSLSACVYVCVCIHMYTRAYSCIQIQICARTQIHKCTHVSVGACMMEGTCCECAHAPPASRALPCAPCVTPDLIRSAERPEDVPALCRRARARWRGARAAGGGCECCGERQGAGRGPVLAWPSLFICIRVKGLNAAFAIRVCLTPCFVCVCI